MKTFFNYRGELSVHEDITSPGSYTEDDEEGDGVGVACRPRSRARGEDPYLGLQNLRSTPQERMDAGLMSRRTRTVMPTSSAPLQSKLNVMQKQ